MVELLDLIAKALTDFLHWYSTEAIQGNFIDFFLKQFTYYILLQIVLCQPGNFIEGLFY